MKYGRRDAKNAPALRLTPLLTGVIPVHPISEDYLSNLTNWQMLGNDNFGVCVSVTWANQRRVVTYLIGNEVYPSLDQVFEFYKTQNPGFVPDPNNPVEDNGMDIQTALEDLHRNGGPDGIKVLAFAKVDHTNLEEVKAALAIFGQVWTGIKVLQANQDEFSNGQPWDYVPGSPVDGGHSVDSGGYTGQSNDDVRFITWAAETGFTDNFWKHLVEEAWVVIWPEMLGTAQFQAGVDLQQLAADYKALTGKDLPIPVPTPPPPSPTPTPTPTPSPTPTPTPPPMPPPHPITRSWWERFVAWLEWLIGIE